MLLIGISYHGGTPSYDRYAAALHRAAQAESVELQTRWLAGHDAEPDGTIAHVDALCLTGGLDVDPASYGAAEAMPFCEVDPRRDRIERLLLASWRERTTPLLAVCRGAQLLNVVTGGSLIPDLGARNATHEHDESGDRRHAVNLSQGSLLEQIAGARSGEVNSSHHQAVDRLAEGFHVAATAPDGTIEGYELADRRDSGFLLAVQWHPERMDDGEPLGSGVFRAFVRNTARHPEGT